VCFCLLFFPLFVDVFIVQPVHVDDTYTARKDLSPLVESGFRLAHPQSRPTYSASRGGGSLVSGGATFSTNYRNSGLYDADSSTTGRVAREVAEGLQKARSQQIAGSYRQHYPLQQSSPDQAQQAQQQEDYSQAAFDAAYEQAVNASAAAAEDDDGVGYYTNDVRDAPPPGAEIAASSGGSYRSNLAVERRAGASSAAAQRDLAGDPLKEHPLDNAYRKARTVYKRSYGLSM
jgi:hypothetical protein